MKLDRKETKCLQGIAILLMLGLHLFNRINIAEFYDVKFYIGEVPFLTKISYIFDACVPIYLFCSGYGLYISENNGSSMKKRIQRVLKLLIRFWIVMIITCFIGFILGMRKIYPGSLLNFILNACLLKSSYVGAFWFVQTYTILVLLSGCAFKLIKRYSHWLIMVFSLIFYVIAFGIEYLVLGKVQMEVATLLINMLMLFLRSQFPFMIGMLFAKGDMIDHLKVLFKIRNSKILVWSIIIILVMVRAKLTHMIFAPTFVFASRNIFIILFTLIILTLLASYIVDWIYEQVCHISSWIKCRRNKYE